MAEVVRLTEADVLAVRRRMAGTLLAKKDTFGSPEPLYPDRLSMAVQRQYTSSGRRLKYRRVHEVGATLFFGIAMDHPFDNGNKRTALISLLVVLDRNKCVLTNTSEDDLYDLAKDLVTHELELPDVVRRNSDSEVSALASWIRARVKPILAGDRMMRFSELRGILEALGCRFDKPDKNFIKIHNKGYAVKTGYPRGDFYIAVNEIKRIRRALHLDASHGVDSYGFYDIDSTVDRFVTRYRDLMRRLACL